MTHPDHVHPRSKRTAEKQPYRQLFKPLVPRRNSQARSRRDYRAAYRNEARGERKSLTLKAERIALGITRSQHDRNRFYEAAGLQDN